MKFNSFLLFFLLTVSVPISAQINGDYIEVKSGVEYQLIETYDIAKLNKILTSEMDVFLSASAVPASQFKGSFVSAKYAVKLYRVRYRSVVPEYNNRPTIATGLIAIPETGKDSMPVISYQHGTVFTKTEVPSFPDESAETKIMIAQFVSQGYMMIAADYFGMGASELPNSYLVQSSSEQACVDMLSAAKDVFRALHVKPGSLFLHGWSQGGWTTMIFLRRLEEMGIPVTAASTASAPVDAFATMNRWMNNYQPGDAVYLPACASNFILALEYYNQMSGLGAAAIRPEYLQAARDLYNWKIDWTTFKKRTPDKAKDFFNPEFMATGNIGNSPFWQLLEKNQAYRWRCKTPLINYFGESDEVVPVYIAKLPEGFHKLFGSGSTVAESAGAKADHRATYIYSVIHAVPWYDSFLKQNQMLNYLPGR
jgi:hypothetical protein